MKLIFLGTSAAVPTLKRNVPSIALYFEDSGKFWLFDCGEATQHQLKKTWLRLSKLEKVFISHMHGDHLFGLPGMLSTRTLEGITAGVDIHGPEGIKAYVEANRKASNFHLTYELAIHDLPGEPGIIYEDEKFIVKAALLKHSLVTYGFSVFRKPGYRFLVEKALQCGIPEGPLFRELKKGNSVTLDDGRSFAGKDFIEKVDSGRKVTYCGDTAYCGSAVELARDSDVLVHEATFSGKEEALARKAQHSTVEDAARVAREAGAKKLILTHFSPRYVNKGADTGFSIDDLKAEARSFFPDTMLAKDLMEYSIG